MESSWRLAIADFGLIGPESIDLNVFGTPIYLAKLITPVVVSGQVYEWLLYYQGLFSKSCVYAASIFGVKWLYNTAPAPLTGTRFPFGIPVEPD